MANKEAPKSEPVLSEEEFMKLSPTEQAKLAYGEGGREPGPESEIPTQGSAAEGSPKTLLPNLFKPGPGYDLKNGYSLAELTQKIGGGTLGGALAGKGVVVPAIERRVAGLRPLSELPPAEATSESANGGEAAGASKVGAIARKLVKWGWPIAALQAYDSGKEALKAAKDFILE